MYKKNAGFIYLFPLKVYRRKAWHPLRCCNSCHGFIRELNTTFTLVQILYPKSCYFHKSPSVWQPIHGHGKNCFAACHIKSITRQSENKPAFVSETEQEGCGLYLKDCRPSKEADMNITSKHLKTTGRCCTHCSTLSNNELKKTIARQCNPLELTPSD